MLRLADTMVGLPGTVIASYAGPDGNRVTPPLSDTQTFSPSKAAAAAPLTDVYEVSVKPVALCSRVTPLAFATQMLSPSKARPAGLPLTVYVACRVPVEASSFITLALPWFAT